MYGAFSTWHFLVDFTYSFNIQYTPTADKSQRVRAVSLY